MDAKKTGNERFVVSEIRIRRGDKVSTLDPSNVFGEVVGIEDEIIAVGYDAFIFLPFSKTEVDASNSNSGQVNGNEKLLVLYLQLLHTPWTKLSDF